MAIGWYVGAIAIGMITIDDVPDGLKEIVKAELAQNVLKPKPKEESAGWGNIKRSL